MVVRLSPGLEYGRPDSSVFPRVAPRNRRMRPERACPADPAHGAAWDRAAVETVARFACPRHPAARSQQSPLDRKEA